MDTTLSRCQRPSQRDEPSFPDRANPNRAPERDQEQLSPARGGDSRYPGRCNPHRTRPPLNEDQQGLASRYLPLARAMARRIARSIPQACDDLQSAAYLALVEAAQSFDPSRQIDFAAYARHRIDGALRDVRREVIRGSAWPVNRRLPDFNRVGRDEETGNRVLGAASTPPVGSELEDLELVQEWIRKLPRMQSQAFRHIYLEGKTQEEAAALIGCSAPTLSRLHKDAIATIQYACGRD